MVAELSRLADESCDRLGVLHWALVGGIDQFGHAQLILSITGSVTLMCQRCLTPFTFNIDSESTLVLAKDEESADAIEILLDNDAIDVIVGSKTLSILELVEDEALLTLPLSPRHVLCPDSSVADILSGTKKESPFVILKNLK